MIYRSGDYWEDRFRGLVDQISTYERPLFKRWLAPPNVPIAALDAVPRSQSTPLDCIDLSPYYIARIARPWLPKLPDYDPQMYGHGVRSITGSVPFDMRGFVLFATPLFVDPLLQGSVDYIKTKSGFLNGSVSSRNSKATSFKSEEPSRSVLPSLKLFKNSCKDSRSSAE